MGNSISNTNLYLQTTLCSVLVLTYIVVLGRVRLGSKFQFVQRLIFMLMLYNIGVLFHQWLLKGLDNYYIGRDDTINIYILLIVEGMAMFFEYTCFNVAHWIFAFQYFTIARQAKMAIEIDFVPEDIIKNDNRVNRIFLSFNVIVPTIYAFLQAYVNYSVTVKHRGATTGDFLKWGQDLLLNSVVLLQMVSGLFLGYALYKIRQVISKEDISLVNVKTMTLHVLAFGLYMVAAFVLQVFFDIRNFDFANKVKTRNYYTALLVCNVCSFISQLFFCIIFWQLGKYKEPVEIDDIFAEVKVVEFDEHADLMSRMWNQFMQQNHSRETYASGRTSYLPSSSFRPSNLSSNRAPNLSINQTSSMSIISEQAEPLTESRYSKKENKGSRRHTNLT